MINGYSAEEENFKLNGKDMNLLGNILMIGTDENDPTKNVEDIPEWSKNKMFPSLVSRLLTAKTYL